MAQALEEGEPAAIQRDLVVIGASAGGVDGLQELVAHLPPEFPAAVLIVLHVPSTGTSVLPQILARHGPLPACFPRNGVALQRGQIYVAPADHHMLVHSGHIHLTQGPRENGQRPAVDPLFRSAARFAGARCIGVVLSGLLDDGASGLRFIHEHGGAAVVEDPASAPFPSMPKAALQMTPSAVVATVQDLGAALCRLVDEPIDPPHGDDQASVGSQPDRQDADLVELEDPSETAALLEGPPSALTCPECGGALWEQYDRDSVRYACHVGHAYTTASLIEEQGTALEGTLWSAVRALEERADVHRRLARRVGGSRTPIYEERAREAEKHARDLRHVLGGIGRLTVATDERAA